MRTSIIAHVVAGLAVVFAVTACASQPVGGTPAAGPETTANQDSPSLRTGSDSIEVSEIPTATPQQKQQPPAAVTTSIEATITIQREGLGLLAVKNTGKQPITLQGWATLQFLGMDDSPLNVPVENVEIPGEGPQITLKPGTNAFAGVKWETGDKADTDTLVATTIKLTPPNGTKSQVVQLIGTDGKPVQYAEFPLKSVQVGTLQPATQGVLAF